MSYYLAKVKVHMEDEKGHVKKVTEQYVVDAVSITDAEVKINKEFDNSMLNFEVVSVSEMKLIKVIN